MTKYTNNIIKIDRKKAKENEFIVLTFLSHQGFNNEERKLLLNKYKKDRIVYTLINLIIYYDSKLMDIHEKLEEVRSILK